MPNNRILKNTVMLYIRMAVIMLVSLYTSRVVLDTLGIQDYGIYNIVGGVVISLSFISNSLVSSTQRFISYEIGLKEKGDVSKVFSVSLNIHFIYLIIILVLFETIGLYLLNNVLSIPDDRLYAANFVYQFSVFTFCSNLLRIPYNAMIISFEEMRIYAILSIVEALLRLFVVFILVLFPDKLIAYGILTFVVTMISNLCYVVYCRVKFRQECSYKYANNPTLFRQMIGFSGWNLVGGATGIAVNEGPNYFMNIFLGVTVNASMGIAKQVSAAVYTFASNFQTAFNPMIVKTYAQGDYNYLCNLIIKTSQLSYYLLLIFAIPIIIFSTDIFQLWLVEVPEYAVSFSILLIISQLISALGSPMWMSVHAVGNIRNYQLTISFVNLLILPISWYLLSSGYHPNYVLAALILLNILILGYRIWYLNRRISFPLIKYFKVVYKCVLISFCCIAFSYIISYASSSIDGHLLRICGFLFSFVGCCLIVLFLGIPLETRKEIFLYLRSKVKHK